MELKKKSTENKALFDNTYLLQTRYDHINETGKVVLCAICLVEL